MGKRSGKWYRNNEKEVMEKLGLTPTPNSGSGWIVKEDGQSEDIICQLKSTDAGSIKINLQDIHKLQYNASVVHKVPVFAVQFIKTNEVFLLIRPEDLQEVNKGLLESSHINIRALDKSSPESLLEPQDNTPIKPIKVIKSSNLARQEMREEMRNKYVKKEKSAKWL